LWRSIAAELFDLRLEFGSVSHTPLGFFDEKWVLVSVSLELVALLLLGEELHEAHSLHGVGGLVEGVPATHHLGIVVEGLVSLLELWSIFGVVLWSDDGEGLVGHGVVFLAHVSHLLGFFRHLVESLTHLGEHVELHEVLGEGAVAIGITISAIARLGEAGDGFVVVVRVGLGGGNVGALGFGVVSSPLSAVVGGIAEGSAVSVHESIVGEVLERVVKGDGVLGFDDLGKSKLLLVRRVVAEVDVKLLKLLVAVLGEGLDRKVLDLVNAISAR